METSAYGSDPPTPNSDAANRETQREVRAKTDTDKAKKKRREECCQAHNLEWI
jgi:hypothetical protein